MITLSTRITTPQIAVDFIAEFEPNFLPYVQGEKLVIPAPCGRCGGSGFGPWHQDGGKCYECFGANTKKRIERICVKAFASKSKQRRRREELKRKQAAERAAAKIESQRDWCETNGHGRITFAELDIKRAEQREADKALAADCPTGRITVTGKVISVKWKDNGYGGGLKMTVKTDDGYLVWGSVPRSIECVKEIMDPDGDPWTRQRTLDNGDRVKFLGTVEPSDRDPKFGFFRRPSNAELLNAVGDA